MTKNIRNAISKARKVKCFVRQINTRVYQVVTPKGRSYTVRAEMSDGLRYLVCNCAAGAANMGCYHLIPVALLDTALTGYTAPAEERRAA
jgi:hypothetical protein